MSIHSYPGCVWMRGQLQMLGSIPALFPIKGYLYALNGWVFEVSFRKKRSYCWDKGTIFLGIESHICERRRALDDVYLWKGEMMSMNINIYWEGRYWTSWHTLICHVTKKAWALSSLLAKLVIIGLFLTQEMLKAFLYVTLLYYSYCYGWHWSLSLRCFSNSSPSTFYAFAQRLIWSP